MNKKLSNKITSTYIIFLMIIAGFAGLLVFEGVVDVGDVEATKTIIVAKSGGGNYTTIQAAIDNASAGDTLGSIMEHTMRLCL